MKAINRVMAVGGILLGNRSLLAHMKAINRDMAVGGVLGNRYLFAHMVSPLGKDMSPINRSKELTFHRNRSNK